MCHTVISEILNVLKDKINQVILRNCCVHFRLKLVGWRSVTCVKRSCQRSGTWTVILRTRYMKQLPGYNEVLFLDIKTNTYMKFHVLCFSLLYNLLNLFHNKEISSIQEKIKAYIKTDLCEKLGSLADQVDVHIFSFFGESRDLHYMKIVNST